MNIFGKLRKKELTPWETRLVSLSRKKKKWSRFLRHQKFFFYTTFVLPVFAVVLSIKVVKAYVRIKLRQIAMAQEGPTKEIIKNSPKESAAKTMQEAIPECTTERKEGVHLG